MGSNRFDPRRDFIDMIGAKRQDMTGNRGEAE
jgi:hypothetical protein